MNNLLDNINGYSLNVEQRKVVTCDDDAVLVVAGAGTGKTLTIVGKIKYLVEYKGINPNNILCISFTNEAVNSLNKKINENNNYHINSMTFHRLGLKILNDNNYQYQICSKDLLEYTVLEYFNGIIYASDLAIKDVVHYFYPFANKNILLKYQKLLKKNIFNSFTKLIVKFINLYKSNNSNLELFRSFFKRTKFNYQKYLFLKITFTIYLIYKNELKSQGQIDFDDMLHIGAKLVANGTIDNYQYIIIDEYQDTSYIRYNLIKEIVQRTHAKILVVGDDFQSIYHFTGCDLNLFLNFLKQFRNSKILKIQTTYRNSMELITLAGHFIMKNKSQMKKNLISNKTLNKPIKIIYYDNFKNTYINLVNKISSNCILVLGRNNCDNKLISGLSNSKNINFLTIHKSKGLEADNVIVVNVSDDIIGLPNKIEDNKILKLVTKTKEYYPYEEERRLFYVALTRTKNYVYLMVPRKNPSIFIKEIININRDVIEIWK